MIIAGIGFFALAGIVAGVFATLFIFLALAWLTIAAILVLLLPWLYPDDDDRARTHRLVRTFKCYVGSVAGGISGGVVSLFVAMFTPLPLWPALPGFAVGALLGGVLGFKEGNRAYPSETDWLIALMPKTTWKPLVQAAILAFATSLAWWKLLQ